MTIRQTTWSGASGSAQFTELWITGNAQEIATMVNLAIRSGLLVFASTPTPMGGNDPRIRRYLRLRRTN
ncbi:MAG TPA: hypothetical protein VGD43_14780 [Micromonospora sp.]